MPKRIGCIAMAPALIRGRRSLPVPARMRFGTYHVFQCPPGQDAARVVAEELARAELAEALGFDEVWLPEQHFSPYCLAGDALLLAAHLAARTRRVRIGDSFSKGILKTERNFMQDKFRHGLPGMLHQCCAGDFVALGREPVYFAHLRCGESFHKARSSDKNQSIQPPLTLTTWPVTYSASSEAKNATAAATSSTVGGRPIGNRASLIRRASSRLNSFSSILDGLTTFTVMPFFASSSANERESATTAAFAEAYAEIFAWPNARSAPTAPRLITRPPRPLRICGSAALLIKTTLIKFDAKMSCQSSSEPSARVPQRKSPTLFTRMSSLPKRSVTVFTNCSDRAAVVISASTATQSAPSACSCLSVFCATFLFER